MIALAYLRFMLCKIEAMYSPAYSLGMTMD
jgi:hypothetical protein